MIRIDRATDALLVVDVQRDFCPGGALAVPGGDEIIPGINALLPRFVHVAATQDWHPPGHQSFASAHPGRAPFETTELHGEPKVLWPDHCVQGTPGAAFHPDLDLTGVRLIVRKGVDPAVDSYSTFLDNDHRSRTGLAGALQGLGVSRVILAGLALDFCVCFSAVDARDEGFDVIVVRDLCRAIDQDGSLAWAESAMAERGVTLCDAAELEG